MLRRVSRFIDIGFWLVVVGFVGYLAVDYLNERPAAQRAPEVLYGGKFWGYGRVLSVRWERKPDSNPPDHPLGYNTGQIIDVEVIRGRMREYQAGETAIGVWSYGGDTGIAGSPEIGDLVAYYEDGYAQIWERVDPAPWMVPGRSPTP